MPTIPRTQFGYSDFFGTLIFNNLAASSPATRRGMATWLLGQPVTGQGIRGNGAGFDLPPACGTIFANGFDLPPVAGIEDDSAKTPSKVSVVPRDG